MLIVNRAYKCKICGQFKTYSLNIDSECQLICVERDSQRKQKGWGCVGDTEDLF